MQYQCCVDSPFYGTIGGHYGNAELDEMAKMSTRVTTIECSLWRMDSKLDKISTGMDNVIAALETASANIDKVSGNIDKVSANIDKVSANVDKILIAMERRSRDQDDFLLKFTGIMILLMIIFFGVMLIIQGRNVCKCGSSGHRSVAKNKTNEPIPPRDKCQQPTGPGKNFSQQ